MLISDKPNQKIKNKLIWQCQCPIYDLGSNRTATQIYEGPGSLDVLHIDAVYDPGIHNHVVLDILYVEAAEPDLPLRDGHEVVVQLLVVEDPVGVEGAGGEAEHSLQLLQRLPPHSNINALKLRTLTIQEVF